VLLAIAVGGERERERDVHTYIYACDKRNVMKRKERGKGNYIYGVRALLLFI
jgi:hypothetical protein